MNGAVFSDPFPEALGDYLLLLEKGYPAKRVLPLVGDRYGLSGTRRIVLLRGVDTGEASARRASKRTDSCEGLTLHIDLFNVLFTVANYLCGRTLFIGTDGFLRDNGAEFGKPGGEAEALGRAVELLFRWLPGKAPSTVVLYADEDLFRSDAVLDRISESLSALQPAAVLRRLSAPDRELTRAVSGVLATADSVVVSRSTLPVLDAAHGILTEAFGAVFPDLAELAGRIRG